MAFSRATCSFSSVMTMMVFVWSSHLLLLVLLMSMSPMAIVRTDAFAFVQPLLASVGTSAVDASRSLGGSRSRSGSKLFSATTTTTTTINEEEQMTSNNECTGGSGSVVLADDEEFEKPTLDKRSYRAVRLPNNLEVLLVSDPLTDVEAGAVHVKAGHFGDFDHRAGLAHFNEHMLFLGSKKYPKEDDFEKFIGKNGGMTNAYTDMEDTNFYFSVAPLDHDGDEYDDDDDVEEGGEQQKEIAMESDNKEDGDEIVQDELELELESNENGKVSQALAGALDRFAQFFIAPLFNEDAVERELRAINSEHLNSFTSESWRNYLLLKSSCIPSHPFSKFGCGNYNTLTNGGNINGTDAVSSGGSSPLPDLVKFWDENYVAEKMRACVVGRASLDELQKTVEKSFAGVRSNGKCSDDEEKEKMADGSDGDEDDVIKFQKEHSNHGVAFGKEQLGLIREYVPLVEKRTIRILFATPPGTDPLMQANRPDRVLSHLLGHESPGSLHALLLDEGLINGLSSGTGISTSDFSFCTLTLDLTPKGMANRDHVMSLVWQWINLIKSVVDDEEVMGKYHEELLSISKTHFRFQENGDPTDFCSGAAETLFDYEPAKVMVGNAFPGPYNAKVTKAFLDRFTPDNCIVNIQGSDLDKEEENVDDADTFECSAESAPWQYEKWYRAKYRQVLIPDALKEKWSNTKDVDPRLFLPGLNSFLPTDFSLRSEDPESLESFDPEIDYSKENPTLLEDRPGLTLWHKMDRTFKTPKASLRLLLNSPHVYSTPRTMTLNRIFVKILEDDLNSYIYDATLSGCRARVTTIPSGFSLSVTGYSEKLPHLMDVVTGRMLSIIEEMKADDASGLQLKFDKAVKNLARETKNFRLESPYETASYVSRMLLEDNVWHVRSYLAEMEGEYADANPLTLMECANVAEESLTKRLSATFLCMGNINEQEARNAMDLLDKHFLSKARPLHLEEMPKLRSLRMPTKSEAIRIFGPDVKGKKIPLVLEEVAHSESEENHCVEVILQVGAEHELGYEGIAIIELIGQIAYNSAYNQLRTKEQLGYIVSSFTRKTAGSAVGLSVIVQSSTTKPVELEARVEAWLETFRQELADMSPTDLANEAAAIVAQLLERNMKLGDEIATAWGSIVSTSTQGGDYSKPPFDRHRLLADVLTVEGVEVDLEDEKSVPRRSAADLKEQVLAIFDKHLAADSEERRAIVVRVYGKKAEEDYKNNIGKAGYLSSFDDVRQIKQFFPVWPTAPYWLKKRNGK